MVSFNTAKPQQGVTLVGLMVTVAVVGILVSLAAPSFGRMWANNRIAAQTNDFVGGLNLTRSEAVRRGQSMAIRSSNGSLDFGAGWKVFTDEDGNGDLSSPATPEDGTLVRVQEGSAISATIKRVTRSGSPGSYSYADVTSSMGNRMYIVFNSRGGNDGGTAAFFKICSADSGAKGRIVQVTPSGRISLDSSTETC